MTKQKKELQRIPYQPVSIEQWDNKYRLKHKGVVLDHTIDDTFIRVARALADLEKTNKKKWFKKFLWALRNGAIPAGRILSNAGAEEYKSGTSPINCTVSRTIDDSLNGIVRETLSDAADALGAGCGIGYEFSTLRPKGDHVYGANAATSGPLSFMDINDSMCKVIASDGGRRGAQMATFDIHHPDVLEFIKAKREDGKYRQFNLSLLITKDFVKAVKEDKDWTFSFPVKDHQYTGIKEDYIWRRFPVTNEYIVEGGLVACVPGKTMKAKELWDVIMTSTYEFAEPGFLLIDEINEMNTLCWEEYIRATNPCAEQPLPPFGSCLLGSINLTKFVRHPFTSKASFNYKKFKKVVRLMSRMLDNVVEINNLPVPEMEAEIIRKRRHGLGYTGLGSAMALLTIPYDSPEALEFTETVTETLVIESWKEGVRLSREKGPAPIFTENDDGGIGVRKKFANTKYMKRICGKVQGLREDLLSHGCRYTHCTSIAPTGTISLTMGNNVSNGIEPSFAHEYVRNIIMPGEKSKKQVKVCSYEFLLYKELVDPEAEPFNPDKPLPDYFKTADDISVYAHVDVQAKAQLTIDSAISKTVNVPTDYPYEDFKNVYLYAIDAGLKGMATFRLNPDVHQGVLVKTSDLENITYDFTLDDGQVIRVNGDDTVEYEGGEHSAANLFDALKEGTFDMFRG